MTTSQRQAQGALQRAITTDQPLLEECITTLYDQQTEFEQKCKETVSRNGVGFNSGDAKSLSFCAESIKRGGHLTPWRFREAARRMQKYCGQLAKLGISSNLQSAINGQAPPTAVSAHFNLQSPAPTTPLDLVGVARDLNIPALPGNCSALGRCKHLIPEVKVADTDERGVHRWALGWIRVHASWSGWYCSCGDWTEYHSRQSSPFSSPNFICVHIAAVRLREKESPTYLDYAATASPLPKPQAVEDRELNRRRFKGVVRNNRRRFALAGLGRGLIEAYFAKRNGVRRIEDLTERQWAAAGASVEAMENNEDILKTQALAIRAASNQLKEEHKRC